MVWCVRCGVCSMKWCDDAHTSTHANTHTTGTHTHTHTHTTGTHNWHAHNWHTHTTGTHTHTYHWHTHTPLAHTHINTFGNLLSSSTNEMMFRGLADRISRISWLSLNSMCSHWMRSLSYSACSSLKIWWTKNCCKFSLQKLMHSCSKLLIWKLSKPKMSSTPIDSLLSFLSSYNGDVGGDVCDGMCGCVMCGCVYARQWEVSQHVTTWHVPSLLTTSPASDHISLSLTGGL